jgi:hypothetical protein
MGTDLGEELARALGFEDYEIFRAKGSKHPPYNTLSVAESLANFAAEMLPASPIIDPRGKRISIIERNFPKLAGLQHKTLSKKKWRATDIVAAIKQGTLDLGEYDPSRDDRLRTLFWLPELLRDPDAIYKNAHRIVEGNEVYVRVYDKMGSTVKLAFTLDIKDKKGRIINTVPITSFLTDPKTAMSYVKGKPIYEMSKRKPPEGG